MIQEGHVWLYSQNNRKQELDAISVYPCILLTNPVSSTCKIHLRADHFSSHPLLCYVMKLSSQSVYQNEI